MRVSSSNSVVGTSVPGQARTGLSPHQRATLLICCVGSFMVLLDVSIVNTALPSIQRDLHASFSALQWVVDAYTLSFAVLLLSAGALADRYGRRRLFWAGMSVFTLGSLLCGCSVSSATLDAARALQGIGGAALAPTSLAILATAFPNPSERVRAISLWSAISGVALGIGPTVGGALVVGAGWRWVFFINVPVGLACLLFGVRRLAESHDPHARRIDMAGQLTSVAWLSALTYGFVERGTHPWTAPHVAGPLLAAVVLLAAFLAVERRSTDPMLPLELFRSRLFSSTASVTFLLGFVLISVPFFTVQYFQDVDHLSAFAAGLRMLSFTLLFSIGAPLAGRLARRFGFRAPITIGAALSGAGLLLLSQITPGMPFLDVGWRLAMIGGGFSLMLSPLSAAALASVEANRAGLASSVANTTRQVGTVVGVALLGALVQTTASSSAISRLSGLPPAIATPLASALGHGGAQLTAPTQLPAGWTQADVARVGGEAYVAGIHSAFIVGGAVLLIAAFAAGLLIRVGRERPLGATEAVAAERLPQARVGAASEKSYGLPAIAGHNGTKWTETVAERGQFPGGRRRGHAPGQAVALPYPEIVDRPHIEPA
jgi:EmrB/QacA subfamily drug resistance transporter